MRLSSIKNLLTTSNEQAKSLYDKLGGEVAIDEVVSILYRKIIEDEQLRGFFEGIRVHYQQYKQKVFLTMVLGGPTQYTGKDLRKAHERLVIEKGLGDLHFDRVVDHLQVTLEELNISTDEIDEVIAIAKSTRNDVLSR